MAAGLGLELLSPTGFPFSAKYFISHGGYDSLVEGDT